MRNELIEIFEKANRDFLAQEIDLFHSKVSERALCGSLMMHLKDEICKTRFSNYKVDVEYNRNKGDKLKTIQKTVLGPEENIIPITCDLIVHSRGKNVSLDNLIAVEMKKSTRPQEEKESDRMRLKLLTSDSFDNIWSYDGTTLPEHVCRYMLGIYYEVDFATMNILLEYYKQGSLFCTYSVQIATENI
ncbi:MAG: hypothetical protein CVV02_11360 [Firmicutes bacterium HGW-Firmicutes-7]|nr:MAG: hypothetical protein CVV02_11360 [Firmicutes bacterium HGW-Firmicutes-7]